MESVEYDPKPPKRLTRTPASLSKTSVNEVYFPLNFSASITSVNPVGSVFTDFVLPASLSVDFPITSTVFDFFVSCADNGDVVHKDMPQRQKLTRLS